MGLKGCYLVPPHSCSHWTAQTRPHAERRWRRRMPKAPSTALSRPSDQAPSVGTATGPAGVPAGVTTRVRVAGVASPATADSMVYVPSGRGAVRVML